MSSIGFCRTERKPPEPRRIYPHPIQQTWSYRVWEIWEWNAVGTSCSGARCWVTFGRASAVSTKIGRAAKLWPQQLSPRRKGIVLETPALPPYPLYWVHGRSVRLSGEPTTCRSLRSRRWYSPSWEWLKAKPGLWVLTIPVKPSKSHSSPWELIKNVEFWALSHTFKICIVTRSSGYHRHIQFELANVKQQSWDTAVNTKQQGKNSFLFSPNLQNVQNLLFCQISAWHKLLLQRSMASLVHPLPRGGRSRRLQWSFYGRCNY